MFDLSLAFEQWKFLCSRALNAFSHRQVDLRADNLYHVYLWLW